MGQPEEKVETTGYVFLWVERAELWADRV